MGGAGPVVQIILRARDGVSNTIRQINRQHQLLNQTIAQTNRAWAASNSAMAVGAQNAAAFTGQVKQNTQAIAASRQETERFRISFLGMLRVMALFAINLQIIRAATSPFAFFSSARTQAADFQQQLSLINALLRTTPEEMKVFARSLRQVAGEYGIALGDIASGAREIASSVDSLVLGTLTQAQAVTKIVEQAARGAVVDGASAVEVANSLLTTLAALQTPVSESDRVLGLLFATVDVGRVTFQQISQEIGTFSATMRSILPQDAALARQFTEEIMAMFGALTQVMPASEAATGVNRLLMSSAFKKSKGEQQIADQLSKLTGIDVTQTAVYEHGPMEFVRRIGTILGRESPLIQQIASGQAEASSFTDAHFEALQSSTSGRLVAAMFKNVRALRPILLLMQNDAELLQRVNAALADSISETDRAIEIAMDNLNKQVDRFGQGVNSLKVSIATPFVEEATDVVKNIADSVNDITNQEGFDELSASQKIKRVLDAIVFEIDRWWESGGRNKVASFTEEFVSSLMTFLNTAVINNTDKLVQLGVDMSVAVIKGIFKGMASPDFLNPLNNPLIGGLILSSFLPGGSTAQRLGRGVGISALATGGLGGSGGLFDGAMSLGIQGLGAYMMFKGFGMRSAQNTVQGIGRTGLATGIGVRAMDARAGIQGYYGNMGAGIPTGFYQDAGGRWRDSATNRFVKLADVAQDAAGNPVAQIGLWEAFRRAPGSTARTMAGRVFSSPWTKVGGTLLGLDAASRVMGYDNGIMGWLGGGNNFERGVMQGDKINASNTDVTDALIAYGESLDRADSGKGAKPGHGFAAAGFGAGLALSAGVAALTGGVGLAASPWIIGGTTAAFSMGGALIDRHRSKSQFDNETAGRLIAQERQILTAFGLQDKLPAGVFQAVVKSGRSIGLEGDELMKFIAFNMGVMAQESGFNPNAHGDTNLGGTGSYGLYQLYTGGGQGSAAMEALGITDPNALKDPVLNAQIGSANIAAVWKNANASDPNFFFRMAQISGHPNESAAGVPGARAIENYAKQYYERALTGETFVRTANGGVTSTENQISISGDLNINLANVGDLDDFIEQMAERVASTQN